MVMCGTSSAACARLVPEPDEINPVAAHRRRLSARRGVLVTPFGLAGRWLPSCARVCRWRGRNSLAVREAEAAGDNPVSAGLVGVASGVPQPMG